MYLVSLKMQALMVKTDSTFKATYDNNNNFLSEISDNDNDGNADYIVKYSYDSNGNLLSKSIDENGDGTPEQTETITWIEI